MTDGETDKQMDGRTVVVILTCRYDADVVVVVAAAGGIVVFFFKMATSLLQANHRKTQKLRLY